VFEDVNACDLGGCHTVAARVQASPVGPLEEGFDTRYYTLPGDAAGLPDVSSLTPVCEVHTPEAALALDGLAAFLRECRATPQLAASLMQGAGLAAEYSGGFFVREAGSYTFSATSSDGSRVWIDGSSIVDNGGVHPMRTASGGAVLASGWHTVRVRFFCRAVDLAGVGLSLTWKGPDTSDTAVPLGGLRVLKHRAVANGPSPSSQLALSPPPEGSFTMSAHFLDGAQRDLPDIFETRADAVGHVGDIDFRSALDFSDQVPGWRPGSAAVLWTGFFRVKHAGLYDFLLASEGACGLWVDGGKVCGLPGGQDGVQMKTCNATLSGGFHSVRVEWVSSGGNQEASVKYAGADTDFSPQFLRCASSAVPFQDERAGPGSSVASR